MNKTTQVKIAKALSFINFARKYKWVINNTDLDETKELKVNNIKKYQRYANKVKIELDWLYN